MFCMHTGDTATPGPLYLLFPLPKLLLLTPLPTAALLNCHFLTDVYLKCQPSVLTG